MAQKQKPAPVYIVRKPYPWRELLILSAVLLINALAWKVAWLRPVAALVDLLLIVVGAELDSRR